MVREFDWINAYDWEKLDAKKFSRERNLSNICDEIFEGSLKSAQSNLPKTVSFYTWGREVDAGSTKKILMYVLSFTDGDFYPQKTKLYNFAKLAPNLRNIVYESPNPYIAGTEYDEAGFPWAPSLSKAFQRISMRKGTVTSLNYPFGTFVSLDAESFWGNSGSGVLVVARDTQRILLGLRSWDVMEPNTWGNFGGAIGISDDGEPEEALPPEDNALKEMGEEINYTGPIEMIPSFTYRSPEFTYYNFIGVVDRESDVPLNQFNWEVSELQWFTLDEVMSLPNLHFGVSALMSQEEMVTFNAEEQIDLGISTSLAGVYHQDMHSVKYDDFGNPFVTFYHATTMDNYESIEAFGLRMSQPGYYEKGEFETYDNVAGVYFTSDLEKAEKWIGWKYRESICYQMESLEEAGYEVSLIPNEIAGVIYAVDFPLDLEYDDLIDYKWSVRNIKPDLEVNRAWYSTDEIPRSDMSIVGFYSLPICLNQGWDDGGDGVQQITESMAKQIHERGFYVDSIPNPAYDEFREDVSTDSAMIAKHGFYQTPFTDATRRGRRYLPLHHILSPRDPIFSGYRGTFMSESVPMADWDTLSPIELVDLITFPSDDGHGDAWDMYIPRDWPHHAVLDKAEDEITQRLRALPQGFHPKERRKIFDETYSKYFDFWYIPGTEYSMTGGGYQELTQSIQDNYENDYFKEEAEKRGIPFDTNLSLEEARKYLPKSTVDWAEKNNRLPYIYAQALIKAMIQDYLDLGRDKIFYTPLLAAAPMEAEVGTDASKGAGLIAGWHRDAYANLLYQQDPSQGGAPTVFFKPKEEYL